ncbi:lipase 1-like [Macrosteles quadrilineatus]|uniref:lipase 1-like n=1 Tax=Macrosteles quadrilineatus TaxID=74068 RepID=UPI0023E2E762|nr:lipase 1-like [Macrosteles quadrilineatus]
MSSIYVALALILTFSLNFSLVISDDEDLDVKGPLMFKNPDGSLMTTKQQIEARKYKGESHTVTTDDGYILTLFRVTPAKQPATVVLLQHALLMSSDAWVTDNKSLAFTLTDAGYDVWMANSRGNCYSRKHTTFDPDKDRSFWNFGLHELGTKDLPAVIDYILKTTGQTKLHLAAHSGGNSMAFAMASQKPEYNDKLKSLQALSPFVFVSKIAEMIGPDGMVEAMTAQYILQQFALKHHMSISSLRVSSLRGKQRYLKILVKQPLRATTCCDVGDVNMFLRDCPEYREAALLDADHDCVILLQYNLLLRRKSFLEIYVFPQ